MAKLPNFALCQIPEAKLAGYLLADEHPDGRAKARFLQKFGFSVGASDELRTALLEHAATHEITGLRQTEFGIIYEIDGNLASPDRRDPIVRVVWMIDSGADQPRLITLVPLKEFEP